MMAITKWSIASGRSAHHRAGPFAAGKRTCVLLLFCDGHHIGRSGAPARYLTPGIPPAQPEGDWCRNFVGLNAVGSVRPASFQLRSRARGAYSSFSFWFSFNLAITEDLAGQAHGITEAEPVSITLKSRRLTPLSPSSIEFSHGQRWKALRELQVVATADRTCGWRLRPLDPTRLALGSRV